MQKHRDRTIEMKQKRKEEPWRFIWHGVNKRCNNSNSENYKYYGGKGIKNNLSIEDIKYLWFRDKAYNLKKPSIDREDTSKNYNLDNCSFIEYSKNCSKATAKAILQYDLEGNFIKEWKSSMEASRYFHGSDATIRHCLYGKNKSGFGYQWKIKKADLCLKILPIKPNLHLPTNQKIILQFSLDGMFINQYSSAKEAYRETGIEYTTICDVAKSNFKRTAGGFKWKYKE